VNSWKVILATMVIFGTGVVTGGLLVRFADQGRERRPPRGTGVVRTAPLTAAGLMRLDFLRRVERDLELTPEQHGQVDKILRDGQERMKKLMETVEPRRREEFKRVMEELRTALSPEQRKRLDALLKQQQQRARDQRKAAPGRERLPQRTPPGMAPATTNAEASPLAKPAGP
jgi:hypothetical protein